LETVSYCFCIPRRLERAPYPCLQRWERKRERSERRKKGGEKEGRGKICKQILNLFFQLISHPWGREKRLERGKRREEKKKGRWGTITISERGIYPLFAFS